MLWVDPRKVLFRGVTEFSAPTGGELAVPVTDEESEAPVGVVEVHEQVARLLVQPRAGRVRACKGPESGARDGARTAS